MTVRHSTPKHTTDRASRTAQLRVQYHCILYLAYSPIMRRYCGALQATLQRCCASSETGLCQVLDVQSVLSPLPCRHLAGYGSRTSCQSTVVRQHAGVENGHEAAAYGQSPHVLALQLQLIRGSHLPAAISGQRASSSFDERSIGHHHRQTIDQRIIQASAPPSLAKSALTVAWARPATRGLFSPAHRLQRKQLRQYSAHSSSQQHQSQDAHGDSSATQQPFATQQRDDRVLYQKPDKEVLYRGKVHTIKSL